MLLQTSIKITFLLAMTMHAGTRKLSSFCCIH